MAPINTPFNLSSSPPSGGTRTRDGTPSTLATFMSPDTGQDGLDNAVDIEKLELGTPSQKYDQTLHERRNKAVPPVDTSISNTRLSGKASVFTPTTYTPGMPMTAQDDQSSAIGKSSVRDLLYGSSPDTHSLPSTPETPRGVDLTVTSQTHGVIGSGPSAAAGKGMIYNAGVFTVEQRTSTRAFLVSGFRVVDLRGYEYIAHTYRNFTSLANINASSMREGIYCVEFHDHAEAKQASELTFHLLRECDTLSCYWLLPKEVARANNMPTTNISNHVAEYIISLVDVGARVTQVTAQMVFDTCVSIGLVKAFRTIRGQGNAIMSFHVEFSDDRTNATQLCAASLAGYRITVVPYTPDVSRASPITGITRSPQSFDLDAHTRKVMSFLEPSTPRAIVSTAHNVVDLVKIITGQDVRTTIMLRNIPNRVDQDSLKGLLDVTSKGKYDFMYLRIDFANNCNVGYAFINFVDPLAIIPFAKARAGQKWNLFQSDKVAEISYATIQGRDCLIQKFRNSSVMLERTAFRPKLYKTGNGPDAGEEEEFPPADNQAKLKRSCDNAEHVGLYHPVSPHFLGDLPKPIQGPDVPPPRFQRPGGQYAAPAQDRVAIHVKQELVRLELSLQQAQAYPSPLSSTSTYSPSLYAPREGQAYRERQRRQFSQFDRGTPLAQSELAGLPDRMGSSLGRASFDSMYGGMAARYSYGPDSKVDTPSATQFGIRQSQATYRPALNTSYLPHDYILPPFQTLHL